MMPMMTSVPIAKPNSSVVGQYLIDLIVKIRATNYQPVFSVGLILLPGSLG